MTTYKLTAPNDVTVRIGGHLEYFWMILGEAYTDRRDVAEHLESRGYTIEEVASVPAEHHEMVARLEAWPHAITLEKADGADPEHHYRFAEPDGTLHDIRDLLSGALSVTPTA